MNLSRYIRLLLAGLVLCLGALSANAFAATPMVSAGVNHTVALNADGTVVAWGDNTYGQLGDGTKTEQHSPVKVLVSSGGLPLSGVVEVAAGGSHTVVRKSDGTVWAWGSNSYGQLGNGATTDSAFPVKVSGLGELVQHVAAGGSHTIALLKSGGVMTWGRNVIAQLGDGTYVDRPSPVVVPGLSRVNTVSAGNDNTFAVDLDGIVWGWGANINTKIDGTWATRLSPSKNQFITGVAIVSAGGYHTIALKADGTVWAWGDNALSQLGVGQDPVTLPNRGDPQPVLLGGAAISGVGVIAAPLSGYHSLAALKADGTVWAWGDNSHGQLGDGTQTKRLSPVQVSGFSGASALAAGGNYSVALKADGTVWAWGANDIGQLGDGTATARSIPVQVPGLNLKDSTYTPPSGEGTITVTLPTIAVGESTTASAPACSNALLCLTTPPKISSSPPNVCTPSATTKTQTGYSAIITGTGQGTCQITFDGTTPNATGTITVNGTAVTPPPPGTTVTSQITLDDVFAYELAKYNLTADQFKFTIIAWKASQTPISDARVFAYAAANHPDLFSGTPTAGQYQQYDYRCYQANCLAVDASGAVYFSKGPTLAASPTSVGAVASFATVITAWEASSKSQTITFGAAPTIVVNGTGMVSATATSGLVVSFSSMTRDICAVTGNTVTGTAAGTCTIAANQAGDSTHNFAPQVTQNITIGPAITNARVFAYAEANYPNFFSGTPTAGTINGYDYRCYQDNCLAVDASGAVYTSKGPTLAASPTSVGTVTSLANAIIAWEATIPIPLKDNKLNMKINGAGYFTLLDSGGNWKYSLNGQFTLDANGFIVSSAMSKLRGYLPDATGSRPSDTSASALSPIQITGVTGLTIGPDGTITAKNNTDGTTRTLGWVALAAFPNATQGSLPTTGEWVPPAGSGTPAFNIPGSGGNGVLQPSTSPP